MRPNLWVRRKPGASSFRDGCLPSPLLPQKHGRRDYNRVRPHSALGNLTPEEFARLNAGRGQHQTDDDTNSAVVSLPG